MRQTAELIKADEIFTEGYNIICRSDHQMNDEELLVVY
jgi:hypothetical protein